MPAMRMMPLAFPDDPAVADMFDEYMFGDALLVAPVLTAGRHEPIGLPAARRVDRLQRQQDPSHGTGHRSRPSAPLDVIPRYVRAGSIVPRGDILQSNNNWTPNWAPALRIEFYPAAGVASRFEYYTGTAVVPMTGSMSAHDGELASRQPRRSNGVLEVHGIDRFTSVRRNNQTLGSADFQHNAATGVMTIPLSGATSVQIRR